MRPLLVVAAADADPASAEDSRVASASPESPASLARAESK